MAPEEAPPGRTTLEWPHPYPNGLIRLSLPVAAVSLAKTIWAGRSVIENRTVGQTDTWASMRLADRRPLWDNHGFPRNIAALLLARSGLGHKKGLILGQSVGTIDADYADQILISAWLRTPPRSEPLAIEPGDRIAQLVLVPIVRPSLRVVDSFSATTVRGLGGFGSTSVRHLP